MSTDSNTIGLFGTGLLGRALAHRFLAAGFTVLGYDPSPAALQQFDRLGGTPVEPSTAAEADFVVLCLPDSNCVESLLADISSRLRSNAIVIDTTTGDPGVSRQLAENLRRRSIRFVDASVLGSSEVTAEGNAVLLAGGTEEAIAECRAVLLAVSEQLFHTGEAGSGQQMKLVANLVLGLNRAALAEGLHFAASFGMNLHTVLDVLKSGAAYSRAMDAKGLRMVEQSFEPQARLSQHLKDVRLMLSHAQQTNTCLPLTQLHERLLQQAESAGYGSSDNSAVIKAWQITDREKTDDE